MNFSYLFFSRLTSCVIAWLIIHPVYSQTARLSYYIFGTKTGNEEYKIQNEDGATNYAATVTSRYFNNINKSVSISFSNGNQIATCKATGSSFSWYDPAASENLIPKQTLMQAANEPLPVSLLGLLVKQYKKSTSVGYEKNLPDIQFHGKSFLTGISEKLNCYSVGNITWGLCFIWLNDNYEVKAAVCPLVYYTLFIIPEDAEDSRPALEKEYAKISLKYYANKITPYQENGLTAITHVRLWDGSSDEIWEDMTIVISKKKILSIIPSSKFHKTNENVIDGAGKTVIPGLWEMHMHIRQPEWLIASIAAGITYVRDMGNNYDYIKKLSSLTNKPESLFPYIYKNGWIDAKGNWSFQYSGYQANTIKEAIKWINKYSKGGFDQIKIWENTSKEITQTILTASHDKGLKVVGHIPEAFSFSDIIKAGINEISHLSEIVYAYEQDSGYNTVDKVVELFKKYKTGIDPTFLVMDIGWRNKARPLSDIEPGAAFANKYVLKVWESFGTDSVRSATRGEQAMKEEGEMIYKLYKAGVPIVAGTDGGIPGHSLHRELELYVKYGLTPMEALRTATVIPAQRMSNYPERFFIRAGNVPNFVILNGNPFKNINNVRNVFRTIINGKILLPDNLWKLIDFRPANFK